ncbi:MAG: hypothetical protein Q9M10_00550 [Mariprofundaceae bacterium]|nr:hypothetical protein [Mariprofundaceae bacterium]
MINLLAAQILSLPVGSKSDVAPKMPWPNGSLVTAKVIPTDSEGSVILSLGGYRLRAQVPPNTPLGHVWLLLLSREMPAQFRLLHEAHAVSMLAEMLAKKTVKEPQADVAKRVAHATQQGWQKVESDGLPFIMEQSASGQYVMLHDRQDASARGMLQRKKEGNDFLLHGRVDLDALGAVMFSLHCVGGTWQFNVYADQGDSVDVLRQSFPSWLTLQAKDMVDDERVSDVEGRVIYGLPDAFNFLNGLEG